MADSKEGQETQASIMHGLLQNPPGATLQSKS